MSERDTRYDKFDLLVKRHSGFIRRFCWWRTSGRGDDCADLMQECLAELWRSRHRLRPDASPSQERLWVKYICRSVYSHLHRSPRPEHLPFDEAMAPAEPPSDTRELIAELSSTLSPDEHRLLNLILDGYSVAEIAHLLQIQPASVSQARYRIIQKMKQQSKNIDL